MSNLQNVFESKNFDPISYINAKFPDENSLSNLDTEIDTLKSELDSLNSELMTSIHEHALLNSELQSAIKKSNTTTKEIIKEVSTIKEKADRSFKFIIKEKKKKFIINISLCLLIKL